MNFHTYPVTYVGQVDLVVENMERARLFYEKVIGFKVVKEASDYLELSADGENTLLTLSQPQGVSERTEQTTGLFHFAILLPKRNDLAQVVRHFSKVGIPFGSGDHWVSEAIYLNDLEGNGIEIYCDRDDADWSWINDEVQMTTEAVDFEDLLSKETSDIWQGLPEKTVMGHVHLQVADIDENERFYVDGLGFDIVNRYGDQALFVSDQKYHHHIAFNTWHGTHLPNRKALSPGLSGYTLILPDEAKLKKIVEDLQGMGYRVKKSMHGSHIVIDPSELEIKLKVIQ